MLEGEAEKQASCAAKKSTELYSVTSFVGFVLPVLFVGRCVVSLFFSWGTTASVIFSYFAISGLRQGRRRIFTTAKLDDFLRKTSNRIRVAVF